MSFVTRFSGKKCAVLCTLVIGFFFVALFPNWYLNVYMYPYFVLGYFYADQKSRIEKFTWLKYISIISFPLLFTLFEKKQYIYTSDIFGKEYSVGEYVRMDVIRWLIGLVGSGFAVTLIQQLSKIRRFRKLGRRIAVLGQKSLQVYVLSVVFLSYYLPILIRNIRRVSVFRDIYTLCSSNPIVYDMVFTLFIAVLYAVVLCWIINILEKLKISKLIFGR